MAKASKMRRRRRIALGALAIVVAIAAIAAGALAVAPGRDGAQEQNTPAPAEETQEESAEAEQGGAPETAAWVSKLDSDGQLYVSWLASGIWLTADRSCEVRFSADGTLSVVRDGQSPATHDYELSDMAKTGDDNRGRRGAMTLDGAAYTFQTSVTLADAPSSGTSTQALPATSEAFMTTTALEKGKPLYRTDDPEAFEVRGFGSELSALVGDGNADTAQAALENYCLANVPLAHTATWGKQITFDYEDGTAQTEFDCDNSRKTKVYMGIRLSDGRYGFSTSKSGASILDD